LNCWISKLKPNKPKFLIVLKLKGSIVYIGEYQAGISQRDRFGDQLGGGEGTVSQAVVAV